MFSDKWNCLKLGASCDPAPSPPPPTLLRNELLRTWTKWNWTMNNSWLAPFGPPNNFCVIQLKNLKIENGSMKMRTNPERGYLLKIVGTNCPKLESCRYFWWTAYTAITRIIPTRIVSRSCKKSVAVRHFCFQYYRIIAINRWMCQINHQFSFTKPRYWFPYVGQTRWLNTKLKKKTRNRP